MPGAEQIGRRRWRGSPRPRSGAGQAAPSPRFTSTSGEPIAAARDHVADRLDLHALEADDEIAGEDLGPIGRARRTYRGDAEPAGGGRVARDPDAEKLERAPALFFARLGTARRGVGGRKSTVTDFTVPMTGMPPGVAGGRDTVTSPWNVVCTASSPRPQKRVCRPSVKTIEPCRSRPAPSRPRSPAPRAALPGRASAARPGTSRGPRFPHRKGGSSRGPRSDRRRRPRAARRRSRS